MEKQHLEVTSAYTSVWEKSCHSLEKWIMSDSSGQFPSEPLPSAPASLARYSQSARLLTVLGTVSLLWFVWLTSGGVNNFRDLIFNDGPLGVSLGCCLALVSLSAAWIGLGPFPITIRFPSAILLVTAIILTMGVSHFPLKSGAWALESLFPVNIPKTTPLATATAEANATATIFFYAVGIQGTGMLISSILTRFVWRLRIDQLDSFSVKDNSRFQFTIRHLLYWTATTAVVLGAVQVIVQSFFFGKSWSLLVPMPLASAVIFICTTILLMPIPWTILSPNGLGLKVSSVIAAVFIVTFMENAVLLFVSSGAFDSAVLWWLNGSSATCLIVNLLIVRLSGYRLVRDTGSSR